MDEINKPKCSRDPDPIPQEILQQDQSLSANTPQKLPVVQFKSGTTVSVITNSAPNYSTSSYQHSIPQIPLIIKPSDQMTITTQPLKSGLPTLPSPMSLTSPNQPQTLFLQALSKLNESSLNFNLIKSLQPTLGKTQWKPGDMTPPDSLSSAPPSYSFVLRQIAARRRPRHMGTFIPSPSFVPHTPPPSYATAFDIYIDPGPPPPPRVYTYGFTSIPVVCPECGYSGMTATTCKVTLCTHLCAFILCIFCCWVCAPLPYILRSCKDVYHYCRNCRNYMGMYCPTNPDPYQPRVSVL